MTDQLFLCGDAHGHYERLIRIGNKYRPLVILGDIGFEYDFLKQYQSDQTYLLGGNHDNYPKLVQRANYLGDFGYKQINGVDFFFVRGAYSIDKWARNEWINWWREEELNYKQSQECINEYILETPNIVLSHDCPSSILCEMFGYNEVFRTTTGSLLDALLEIHRPKLWIFGHHHKSVDKIINGTRFICLNELEVMELPI